MSIRTVPALVLFALLGCATTQGPPGASVNAPTPANVSKDVDLPIGRSVSLTPMAGHDDFSLRRQEQFELRLKAASIPYSKKLVANTEWFVWPEAYTAQVHIIEQEVHEWAKADFEKRHAR